MAVRKFPSLDDLKSKLDGFFGMESVVVERGRRRFLAYRSLSGPVIAEFVVKECQDGWCMGGPTPASADATKKFIELSYFTPERIWHEADVQVTFGHDELRRLLAKALIYVPIDVVDRAFDECRFLMAEPKTGGEYIPASVIGGRHIILLPHNLLDKPVEEQIETVLHETAHVICGHNSPLEDIDVDYEQQEKEACELVEQWKKERESWDKTFK